jgi:LmbE family N-acetylglucosaminyl deacetylase
MKAFMEQMPQEARDQGMAERIPGTPDELITTKVDVSEFVDRKREAFAAHVSQNPSNSWFSTMQDSIYRMVFGTEYYELARGKPGSTLPESDVFAGVG